MRGPSDKQFEPAVSAQFVRAIHNRLREFDGMRVGDPRTCPSCGSDDYRKNGYQSQKKTFARLITDDGIEDVGVEVQLYECKQCGGSYQGDISEQFYEGCEYARPIVDLALFHAAGLNYSDCERALRDRYGLQVDRDTIERYDRRFDDSHADRRGILISGEVLSLRFLSFLFGDDSADEANFVITDTTALW